MESNQIDVVAPTVFRDREEVGHIFETRTSRQVWSDVGQPDRPNRIDFDLTFIHAVAPADLHVGTCPYSDTASDGAASHSLSEPLGENHAASLRPRVQLREAYATHGVRVPMSIRAVKSLTKTFVRPTNRDEPPRSRIERRRRLDRAFGRRPRQALERYFTESRHALTR